MRSSEALLQRKNKAIAKGNRLKFSFYLGITYRYIQIYQLKETFDVVICSGTITGDEMAEFPDRETDFSIGP